jgi:DNA polymerase III delta subunit
VVQRSNPKKKELPSIVATLFKAQGKSASLRLCSDLVDSVGSDIEALNTAVLKVSTYLGEQKTVTEADLKAVIEVSAEIKVWELTDALCSKNTVDALSIFNLMLLQGQSISAIHSAVVKTTRELIIARSLLDERGSVVESEISLVLGKPEWMLRGVLRGAERYTADLLQEGLSQLAELENTIKTSSEGEAAYRRWILEFTSER